MKPTFSQMVMAAVALAGLAACKDEPNPCDSTTYLSGTDCLPKTDGAAPGPDLSIQPAADTGAPAVDMGGGEAAGSATSLLDAPCSTLGTIPECQGPDTDYCAVQPGQAGYCTKSGCVTAADCPAGWSCFDLSKMGITGYPTMCTKP